MTFLQKTFVPLSKDLWSHRYINMIYGISNIWQNVEK